MFKLFNEAKVASQIFGENLTIVFYCFKIFFLSSIPGVFKEIVLFLDEVSLKGTGNMISFDHEFKALAKLTKIFFHPDSNEDDIVVFLAKIVLNLLI